MIPEQRPQDLARRSLPGTFSGLLSLCRREEIPAEKPLRGGVGN